MYPTTGFTYELSALERATNELKACLELVDLHPDNEYWQNRLAAAIVHEHELIAEQNAELDEMIDDLADLHRTQEDARQVGFQ